MEKKTLLADQGDKGVFSYPVTGQELNLFNFLKNDLPLLCTAYSDIFGPETETISLIIVISKI